MVHGTFNGQPCDWTAYKIWAVLVQGHLGKYQVRNYRRILDQSHQRKIIHPINMKKSIINM